MREVAAKQPVISAAAHRITEKQVQQLKQLFGLKLTQATQAHAQQKKANALQGEATTRTDLVAAQREVYRAKGLAHQAKAELQEVSNTLVLKWSDLQGKISPEEHGEFVRLRGQVMEAEALCRGWEDELAATHEDVRARIIAVDKLEMTDQLFNEGTEEGFLMAKAADELRLEALGDPVTEMLERRLRALKGDAPGDAELIRRLNAL